MGIDAAGFGELFASASLHADPTIQSAARIEHPDRVFKLARFGIDWLAPEPLGSDRQLDPARFNVPYAYLGSRKRIAFLDQVARLPQPRRQERIRPENYEMEPTRRRSSGILQVKEFSTGKGIKLYRKASFLQVKEKRQPGPLSQQFQSMEVAAGSADSRGPSESRSRQPRLAILP
jgi:hypothetical protein